MWRHIMWLGAVVLVMAGMMVILAMPVLADNSGNQKGPGNQGPPLFSGNGNPGTSSKVFHNLFGSPGACADHGGNTQQGTGGACSP